MPGRNFLFIPGPTNVPRRIQRGSLLLDIHGCPQFTPSYF